mmetsp:Transcript_6740/g.12049  ORF Transcript_6740/g.12049 Transcript_6740/m.12049 type:complete len:97 (-) Transcript_6740:724-1014(-)
MQSVSSVGSSLCAEGLHILTLKCNEISEMVDRNETDNKVRFETTTATRDLQCGSSWKGRSRVQEVPRSASLKKRERAPSRRKRYDSEYSRQVSPLK